MRLLYANAPLVWLLALSLFSLMAFSDTGQKAERRYLKPEGDFPFSNGVLVGDTLYLAGHIGLDPKTQKPPASPEEEARLVLEEFKATLARAGMSMEDLVYVQVFCSDVSLWGRFNNVYRAHVGRDFPARAFIGSGPLLYGARFEVQGIAVRR
ncbi:MAG TPA: Rid family hydrolase [Terriglobales bacterium]|nr:Rid family hydrolase [Terriglobales bacterium]